MCLSHLARIAFISAPFIRRIGDGDELLSPSRPFCEQFGEFYEEGVLILCNLLTPPRVLHLLSAVSPSVRLYASNAIDGIKGIILSSGCQFELEVLEPGDFTRFAVWMLLLRLRTCNCFVCSSESARGALSACIAISLRVCFNPYAKYPLFLAQTVHQLCCT